MNVAPRTMIAADRSWWDRPAVLAFLVALTALPAAVTTIPPLIDFYSHIGRYKVEIDLASSPLLQRNWDFDWHLIANLGVDILIVPLTALFGLERAAWIVGVALPPLLASGFLRTARAVHGHIPATALAALPFALAYPYQFGFVNYWLGLGLAFHLYASWLNRRTGRLANGLAFGMGGLAIWITHVFAWGVFGVLVGSAELVRIWRAGERRIVRIVGGVLARVWPLLAPLPLMILWRQNGVGAESGMWFAWVRKFSGLAEVLHDQWLPLDLLSVLLVIFLLYRAIRSPGIDRQAPLALAAAVFAGLAILFPFVLFGSAYADTRLWAVVLATGLLSLALPQSDGKEARRVASIAVGLLLVRIAFGTIGFWRYDRDHQERLLALQTVEPGARIAAFVGMPCYQPWRLPRMQHLPSIAIVRREAFVNTQWDVPGAQLITPLGGRGTPFNNDPSQFVSDFVHCPSDLRPLLASRIALVPRTRFDYIWALGFDSRTLPATPGLALVYADERSAMYKIAR